MLPETLPKTVCEFYCDTGLKIFTLKYYFFFQLPLNKCQKFLKGRIHGDWTDLPGEGLNLVEKNQDFNSDGLLFGIRLV